MKLSYLLNVNNSTSYRPRVEMDIAENGIKILNKEGYLRNKPIAKTAIYRLANGIGRLYYLDADDKIVAGAYTVPRYDGFPIIGEIIEEPLEMN